MSSDHDLLLSPLNQVSEALRACAHTVETNADGDDTTSDCEKLLEYANKVYHQNQVEIVFFGTSSVGKSTVLNKILQSDIELYTNKEILVGAEFIKSKTPEITHESIYSASGIPAETRENDADWDQLFHKDVVCASSGFYGYLLPEGTGNTTLIPCKLKYSPSFQIKFHIRSMSQIQELIMSVPTLNDDDLLAQEDMTEDEEDDDSDSLTNDYVTGNKQLAQSMMGSLGSTVSIRTLTRNQIKLPMSMKQWIKPHPSILSFTSPHDNVSDSLKYIKEKYGQYLMSSSNLSGFFTAVEIWVPAVTLKYGTLVDVPGFASLHFDIQRQIDQTIRDASAVIMFLKPEPYSGENYSSINSLLSKIAITKFSDQLYENGYPGVIDHLTRATNLMIVVNPGIAHSYKALENTEPVMENATFIEANEKLKEAHFTVLSDKLLLPVFSKDFKKIKRNILNEIRDLFMSKINTKGFPVTYTQIYPCHPTHHNSGMQSLKEQIVELFRSKSCTLFDYIIGTILPFLEKGSEKITLPSRPASESTIHHRNEFRKAFCNTIGNISELSASVNEHINQKIISFTSTLNGLKLNSAYWERVETQIQEKFNTKLLKTKRFIVTNGFFRNNGELKYSERKSGLIAFEDVMFPDVVGTMTNIIDSIRDFVVNIFKEDKRKLSILSFNTPLFINNDTNFLTYVNNVASTHFRTYEEEATKLYKPTDTIRSSEQNALRREVSQLTKQFFKAVKKTVKEIIAKNKEQTPSVKIPLHTCVEDTIGSSLIRLKESIRELLITRLKTELSHLVPLLRSTSISLHTLEINQSASSPPSSLSPFKKAHKTIFKVIVDQYDTGNFEHENNSRDQDHKKIKTEPTETQIIINKIRRVDFYQKNKTYKTNKNISLETTDHDQISPLSDNNTVLGVPTNNTLAITTTPITTTTITTITTTTTTTTTTTSTTTTTAATSLDLSLTPPTLDNTSDNYVCQTCQFTTLDAETYYGHFRKNVHLIKRPIIRTGIDNYECPKCQFKTNRVHSYSAHFKTKFHIDKLSSDELAEYNKIRTHKAAKRAAKKRQHTDSQSNSESSGPPNKKQRRTERVSKPNLVTMIANNLLPPLGEGKTTWTCTIKGYASIVATLTTTGKIIYNGIEYFTPSRFVNSALGTKYYSGYTYLTIGGKTLDEMRGDGSLPEKTTSLQSQIQTTAPGDAVTQSSASYLTTPTTIPISLTPFQLASPAHQRTGSAFFFNPIIPTPPRIGGAYTSYSDTTTSRSDNTANTPQSVIPLYSYAPFLAPSITANDTRNAMHANMMMPRLVPTILLTGNSQIDAPRE